MLIGRARVNVVIPRAGAAMLTGRDNHAGQQQPRKRGPGDDGRRRKGRRREPEDRLQGDQRRGGRHARDGRQGPGGGERASLRAQRPRREPSPRRAVVHGWPRDRGRGQPVLLHDRAGGGGARTRAVEHADHGLGADPVRERELVTALLRRRVDALLVVPTGTDHRYIHDAGFDTRTVFRTGHPRE